MVSEWPTELVGNISTNFDSQRIPLSSREREKRRGSYPYYGATGIMDYVDDYLFEGLHVLIAEDGSVEREDGTPFVQLVDGKFWVNNHAHVLRANSDSDTRFLFYALSSIRISPFLSGSVQPKLTQQNLNRIPIPWPPEAERHAIAHILGTLDDKIELNRRMSETLEQIARALFKAWFVDFEPVRAKMEGRWKRGQSLPGLPAHLYDLFPDRLAPSELGEIPEGWEVAQIGDVLAELVSGGRPKGGAVEAGVPSVGAENVIGLGKYDFSKEKYIPREFFEELQRKGAAVRPGDILLYKDGAQIGRKTYFDCGFPHTECAVNEHVFILRARHPRYQRYLFFWLDQDCMTQEIRSLNSNSAQPGINQQGVRSLPCLIPSVPVLDAFDQFLRPLTDRLFSACLESRTLAALRDALLPKLISGELRVKDAEWFLKEREL
ncbi:MAG: hypothetical protein KatS3mg087_1697 [Patescibacteria group bacterium]|nr:MAG: hypothetical protein KatS3mg087_1697 [Patescibacteria group bacterium]